MWYTVSMSFFYEILNPVLILQFTLFKKARKFDLSIDIFSVKKKSQKLCAIMAEDNYSMEK